MIKPGTNLCRFCGRTSHVDYYRSGKDGQGAVLEWREDAGAFELTPYRGSSTIITLDPKSKIDRSKYPPDTVSALIGSATESITLSRSCPHCDTQRVFFPDIGRIPCFVIAVIGAPSAGKSAWLGALATSTLGPLNKQDYLYKIEPYRLVGATGPGGATNREGEGNTNYFLIIDKQTDEAVAMIYLLDYAGELYVNQEITPDTPLGRLLLGEAGEGYPGLDAVVIIEPAVADQINKDAAGTNDVVGVLEKIRPTLKNKPVAHVCTFADLLQKQEEHRSSMDPAYIPKFFAKTFPHTAYVDENVRTLARHYTPDAIIQRVHLQDYIARRGVIGDLLDSYYPEQVCNFLVQSCVQNRANDNDYTKQFNVADPLIWLLSRLKLFPLMLSTGGDWR